MKFFVCLGGFSILSSKLHSDNLFTLFPFIQIYTILAFNIIFIFDFAFKITLTSFCSLFISIKTNFINIIQIVLINLRFNFLCASSLELTLLFSWSIISSTAWLTMSLLYFCLLNLFLFVVSCPWSLVSLILEYLEPKFPKTLDSYYECPGPWMRHFFSNISFGLSTYLFLQLSELWSKFFMGQPLLSFSWCDQNGWHLP